MHQSSALSCCEGTSADNWTHSSSFVDNRLRPRNKDKWYRSLLYGVRNPCIFWYPENILPESHIAILNKIDRNEIEQENELSSIRYPIDISFCKVHCLDMLYKMNDFDHWDWLEVVPNWLDLNLSQIGWTAPRRVFFPNWREATPLKKRVTVTHKLRHTSGINPRMSKYHTSKILVWLGI